MEEDKKIRTSHEDSSILNNDRINIQLNNYDYYSSKPTNLDTQHGLSQPLHQFESVPVIRIFGALPSGHQVLCHIHGVFPYFFVKYDGSILDSSPRMNQKCTHFHSSLEELARTRLDSSKQDGEDRKKTSKKSDNKLKYIANVSVIKATDFYGYHVGWDLFYKVSLLKPSTVNKISDIVRSGDVFREPTNIYESHIPYYLQFCTDFNLFGCSWLECDKCFFRKPILNDLLKLDDLLMNEQLKRFLNIFHNGDSSKELDNVTFPRVGNGLLEVDILPQYIRNKDGLEFNDLHHDFVERRDNGLKPPHKRYINSTKHLRNEIKLMRTILGLPKYSYDAIQNRYNVVNKWNKLDELKKTFQKVEKTLHRSDGCIANYNDYIRTDERYANIKRPHECIDELWPKLSNSLNDSTGIAANEKLVVNRTYDNLQSGAVIETHTEYLSDDHNSELDPHSQNDSYLEDAELLEANIVQITNPIQSRQKFSVDFNLTQSMASKRKLKSSMIVNTQFIENSNKKIHIRNKGLLIEKNSYVYDHCEITFKSILDDLENDGYPKVEYKDPYFSNPVDIKQSTYTYAGKLFEISSTHLYYRQPVLFNEVDVNLTDISSNKYFSSWKYIPKPPTYADVKECSSNNIDKNIKEDLNLNKKTKYNYKYAYDSEESIKKIHTDVHKTLTHFTLELQMSTRENKLPDPKYDPIQMIIWKVDDASFPFDLNISTEGVMVLVKNDCNNELDSIIHAACGNLPIGTYGSELEMIDALIDLVLFFDPDIISGFEVHATSWGYLMDRCKLAHKIDLLNEVSRVTNNFTTKKKSKWGYTHTSSLMVSGRHILNIWRCLRSEIKLIQYTIENLSYEILHKRIPKFSTDYLSELWNSNNIIKIRSVIFYWITRVRVNIALLKKQEYIERIIEQARLIGIDFYSVYFRGSQFNVESCLARICKSENFLLLSPGKKQVQNQKPLECVPLVMEPDSSFYKSPLVVLDFQSLYPSVMIAHNYCYSTMVGRVEGMTNKGNIIGVTSLDIGENILTLIKDDINISPNGIVFTNQSLRKSTLAKMLSDILDTRFLVKKTMSDISKNNTAIKRLMNNRQLALKLLANVTYGYASASFSGRMPNSDLSDAIVQTAREILQNAIDLIEASEEWGAKVVYSDTDSLFVYLPGKTIEDAFKIGRTIADEITRRNPDPITLKFEKVYHPCILLSKKRYVGYAYEYETQKEPKFDAKGIETVRRDGHQVQQRVVEKALKILFDSKDLSQVKKYVCDSFTKLEHGEESIQNLCFAKAVKLGSYKNELTAPAGAQVAMREMKIDKRAEPQYKERVPYLVVKGEAGQILRERSISPKEFLKDPSLEFDSNYYITKTLIPPLNRLFQIIGIDINDWANQAKKYKKIQADENKNKLKKVIKISECVNCNQPLSPSHDSLCQNCSNNKMETTASLLSKLQQEEKSYQNQLQVCRVCTFRYTHDAGVLNSDISSNCVSFDCPIYYSKIKSQRKLNSKQFTEIKTALHELNS